MYISERGRLGDNQPPKRITLSMRPKPHLNLDRSPFNKPFAHGIVSGGNGRHPWQRRDPRVGIQLNQSRSFV